MGTLGVRSSAVAFAVLVCLGAVGCTDSTAAETPPSPNGSDSSVQGSEAKGSVESATPAPPEAVIVVAGVDVDGAHVSASGYVSGVIESGGECTFVFAQGEAVVTSVSESAPDRLSTSCGTVQVPIAEFTRGSWTVSLEYKSVAAATASQPMSLEIP